MEIPFTKMNSQGNDFIIIDNSLREYELDLDFIIEISSRQNIGCDQLLIVYVTDALRIDCEIFNQDGTPVRQCGNGLRAVMLYLHQKYRYVDVKIFVKDIAYLGCYKNDKFITIDMGQCLFDHDIPQHNIENIDFTKKDFYFDVSIDNNNSLLTFSYSPLSIGNFHCVVFSKDSFKEKEKISSILQDLYNDNANISFILNFDEFIKKTSENLSIRVNERGAGWTKSCGSGATASAAFLMQLFSSEEYGPTISNVVIEQSGGLLTVERRQVKSSQHLFLSGPSEHEYESVWNENIT